MRGHLLRKRAHLCDVTARVQVMAAHIGRRPSESSRIVERSGQPFGFLEIPPDRRELVQREERLTKVEPEVDRALSVESRGLLSEVAGRSGRGERI